MPRSVTFPKRNPPDALASLCKRFGKVVIEAIKKGTTGNRIDSLKVRLIAFCIDKGFEVSDDEIRKEFSGSNIKSLKFDTIRLIVKVAAQETGYSGQDLSILIDEITWSIENQALATAIELCGLAAQMARLRGEYSTLLRILKLEQTALYEGEDTELLKVHKRKNLDQINECLETIKISTFVSSLRHGPYEEIRSAWDSTQCLPEGLMQEFLLKLDSIEFKALSSSLSKIEYLEMSVPMHLLKMEVRSALEKSMAIREIFEGAETLIRRLPLRYISNLRALCPLLIEQKSFGEAQKILDSFNHPRFIDLGIAEEARFSWLKCALQISYQTGDNELRDKAMAFFDQNKDEFWNHIQEKSMLVVTWIAMMTYLKQRNWRKAYALGQVILQRKSKVKRNVLINVRIALFACEICLYKSDHGLIDSSNWATYKFLLRNEKDFPDATKILKKLYAVWNSFSQGKGDVKDEERAPSYGKDNSIYASQTLGVGYFDFKELIIDVENTLKTHQ